MATTIVTMISSFSPWLVKLLYRSIDRHSSHASPKLLWVVTLINLIMELIKAEYEITYNQVSVAGSYMNYNKSLTNSSIDTRGRNTGIYSAGIKYNFLSFSSVDYRLIVHT